MNGTTRTGMAMALAWALLALVALAFVSLANAGARQPTVAGQRIAVQCGISVPVRQAGCCARMSRPAAVIAGQGWSRLRLRPQQAVGAISDLYAALPVARSIARHSPLPPAAPPHSIYSLTQRLRL